MGPTPPTVPSPRRQRPPGELGPPPRGLATGFGNLTPKFFDYERDLPVGGTTAAFTDLVKFAQAEPRIAWSSGRPRP